MKRVLTAALLLAANVALAAEPTTITVNRGGSVETLSCTSTGCTKQQAQTPPVVRYEPPPTVQDESPSVAYRDAPAQSTSFDTSTTHPVLDRVERECRREYGARGEADVQECKVAVAVRMIREGEAKKINRAYDRAR